MSAVNFDRDLTAITALAEPTAPSATPVLTADPEVETDGVVYTNTAQAFRSSRAAVAVPAGDWISSGVHMLLPSDLRSVFRVKGFIAQEGSTMDLCVGVAISPASPSAGANTCLFPRFFAFMGRANTFIFDETIVLDVFGTISSTDYSARNPCFFVAAINNTGGATNDMLMWSLSVQSLQYANSPYESVMR